MSFINESHSNPYVFGLICATINIAFISYICLAMGLIITTRSVAQQPLYSREFIFSDCYKLKDRHG